MTDDTQPEALRLADELEFVSGGWGVADQCCAELRRQHARIAELEAELEAVGADGVSDPLVGRSPPLPHQPREWSMGNCTFDLAWRGPCKATCEGSVCTQHAAVKCCVCGEQATHECDHTGQFVCGAPLCNNCEGHTDTSKPAGGWGFMNHTHRQKGQS